MLQVLHNTLESLQKIFSAPILKGSDSAGLQQVGSPQGLRGSHVAPAPASWAKATGRLLHLLAAEMCHVFFPD